MKLAKFILPLLLLLFSGCSNVVSQSNYVPAGFVTIREIPLSFIPQKCLYSSSQKTTFVWQKDSNLIHIFQNGIKINSIGGMGTGQTNFNNLSDIALAPDGSLLALDSFARKIKKFDTQGGFIAQFSLNNFDEPLLFDIALDETFYIYDNRSREIVATSLYGQQEYYRFGNFQLKTPSNLILSGNNLVVNDRTNDQTLVFDSLGQFLFSRNGYFQFQNGQWFLLQPYFLESEKSAAHFCQSLEKWDSFILQNGFCVVQSPQKVLIGKIQYEIQ
ncbi:MAG TPA: hypothetical protein PLD62_05415 [Candidatus Cloacimonadota bacterium]|nr:hypothetical protein [Candidatus Cloacimonadota bacterium]